MPDKYPLHEAKARLSSLVRQVREGRSVIITVHGLPAAELRPIDPSVRPPTMDERLAELDARGVITPSPRAAGEAGAFPIGPRVKGGLKRFLEKRD
jgi:prevent-host-death family protein